MLSVFWTIPQLCVVGVAMGECVNLLVQKVLQNTQYDLVNGVNGFDCENSMVRDTIMNWHFVSIYSI